MAAYQPGLNKKISSIFDGVPIPKDNPQDSKSTTKLPDFITDPAESAVPAGQQKQQSPQQYFPSPEPQKAVQKPASKPAPSANDKFKTEIEPKPSFLKNIKSKLSSAKNGTGSARQKLMIVAIPVLVIVLIFVFMKVLKPSKPRRRIEPQPAKAQVQSTSSQTINWEIPKPLAGFFRDPMRFDSAGSYQTSSSQSELPLTGSEIVIKGIVYSDERPTAVIGGHIVHEGDIIRDIVVLKIYKNSIDLEKAGQKRNLKVGEVWPAIEENEQVNPDN